MKVVEGRAEALPSHCRNLCNAVIRLPHRVLEIILQATFRANLRTSHLDISADLPSTLLIWTEIYLHLDSTSDNFFASSFLTTAL